MKKQNKGITLVALVITIILLLILAGIAISSLIGSGLLKKAEDATKSSDRASVKEQLQLAVITSKINLNGSIDKEELIKKLDNLKKNEIIDRYEEGTGNTNIIFTVTKGKNEYEIDEDGNVDLKGVTIVVSGLTVKNGDKVLVENSKEVAEGYPLKVSFKAEIEGGTITGVKVKGTEITNNNGEIEHTTDGSISVTFEIEGKTAEGKRITKEYKVNLKEYYDIPKVKVGDYVNYSPDTLTEAQLTALNSEVNIYSGYSTTQTLTQTSGMKWRVLELDETGTKPKTLISANTTNETLTLYGANGYNNAVYLINEVCKALYSKEGVGEARSIKIEDLEAHYSEAGINAKNSYKGVVRYGDTKNYSYSLTGSYPYFPNIAKEENNIGIDTTTLKTDGLNLSEQGKDIEENYKTYTGNGFEIKNGIIVTQTYYLINSKLLSMYDAKGPYYDLFHGIDNCYYAASRCVEIYENFCCFSIRYVYPDQINRNTLLKSNFEENKCVLYMRPLILLGANIEAKYEGKTEDNAFYIWNI